MTWRIGAVSYLNTKPLIHQLEKHLPDCELSLDLPSRLADRLSAGDLDVALIPSVEYLRGRGFSIVSDACIACRGPVRSVRVLFRTPPSQVKTLALDEGSRTSAALAQVLLAERFQVRPKRLQLDINASIDECPADAILVIGDRAMELDTSNYYDSWDLGEQWCQETGLSFVFAMWVARDSGREPNALASGREPYALASGREPNALASGREPYALASGNVPNALASGSVPYALASGNVPPELTHALQAARDAGLANLDEIVAREAPRYHLSTATCDEYFRRHLHFHLGPRELSGLRLFRDHVVSLGLAPQHCGAIPEALPVV